ncbi:hypothetical protein D9M71_577410 [compost metagenome]
MTQARAGQPDRFGCAADRAAAVAVFAQQGQGAGQARVEIRWAADDAVQCRYGLFGAALLGEAVDDGLAGQGAAIEWQLCVECAPQGRFRVDEQKRQRLRLLHRAVFDERPDDDASAFQAVLFEIDPHRAANPDAKLDGHMAVGR